MPPIFLIEWGLTWSHRGLPRVIWGHKPQILQKIKKPKIKIPKGPKRGGPKKKTSPNLASEPAKCNARRGYLENLGEPHLPCSQVPNDWYCTDWPQVTWDPWEGVSPIFHALWDCMDWPQVTWDPHEPSPSLPMEYACTVIGGSSILWVAMGDNQMKTNREWIYTIIFLPVQKRAEKQGIQWDRRWKRREHGGASGPCSSGCGARISCSPYCIYRATPKRCRLAAWLACLLAWISNLVGGIWGEHVQFLLLLLGAAARGRLHLRFGPPTPPPLCIFSPAFFWRPAHPPMDSYIFVDGRNGRASSGIITITEWT